MKKKGDKEEKYKIFWEFFSKKGN